MMPFAYSLVRTPASAVERMGTGQRAMYIAGGTDMLQLLQDAVVAPAELIDINRMPLRGVTHDARGTRIGALARLADVAADEQVARRFSALAEALRETASPQVRNMATLGGNLLQRTRCLYFRDAQSPCNKRQPGSGCPAREAGSRMNAILGGSESCVATYPGDMAVALVALNASIQVLGPGGARTLPVEELHRVPRDTPDRDTTLLPGELITDILLPSGKATRSAFMKLRDRASFEWALASAAIAVNLDHETVRKIRLVVGGLSAKPWRLTQVEDLLRGRRLDAGAAHEAGTAAIAEALALPGAEFKITILQHLVERIVLRTGGAA
jgi:xanthine dehydrogenase YagS FAD-binding subunit